LKTLMWIWFWYQTINRSNY